MARDNIFDAFFDELSGMTFDGLVRGYNREADIAFLQGENERLRVERDQYRSLFKSYARKCAALKAKLERAGINVD